MGHRLSPGPPGWGKQGEGHQPRVARGVGIEKALAVRQGIEKVFYSKEVITVRFRCGAIVDGKTGPNEMIPSAAGPSLPAAAPTAPKTKEPASAVETGPSFGLERTQNVEHMDWPPTLDVYFANTGHSYWANYRLTGDYKLRPTL